MCERRRARALWRKSDLPDFGLGAPSVAQRLALDGAAAHQPRLLARKILARMDRTPIVPDHEIAEPPFVLVDDGRVFGDIEQLRQRRLAVLRRKAFDARRHQPADIERLFAGRRMGDDDRLLVVQNLFQFHARQIEALAAFVVVHLQHVAALEPIAQRARDVVIGLVHIGEASLAARRGELHRIQKRRAMRLRVIAGVVMEPHFAVAEGAGGFAVLDDVGDHHERRVVIAAGGAAIGRTAADMDLAEVARRAQLIGFRQFLIAKHDDDVLIERGVDGLHRGVVQRPAQIDALDLGAERRRQRLNRHRHPFPPSCIGIKCIRDKTRTLADIRAFPLLPQAGACLRSLATRYFARMQHRRPDRFLKTFLSLVTGASLLFGANVSTGAAEPDTSYKGKTVIISIGFAPGGSYDYFGRLVARHLGKHLPGNPTVIAESMPGAGSFTAANYLYARAPRDGTALGIVSQTVAIEEVLGTSGVQYKVSQFNWIGRATSVNEVSLTFHSSNAKTIRDAIAHETTMASTGAGSPSETYLKLLNAVAATRFKLVGPYPASNDAMLAMERGEVDGAFTSYNTLKVARQDWLREKKINILVQYGERSADLPDVPYAVDLAKTDDDRQLMAFYVSSEQIGRAFLAPPEMPADHVAALRKAYDETMQDPQLLAEIDQSHSEFNPLPGARSEERRV